jgi:hypothetical protein
MSVTFWIEGHESDEDPNLSNVNAARVLDALGLLDRDADGYADLCGAREARVFQGYTVLALALTPADAGVPSTQTGNMIDCGRPAGYLQERITQLHDLAAAAPAGARVCWA